MNIPLTKPYLDTAEEKSVTNALRSGWIAQGPQVAAFEELVARHTQSRFAIATSSATTALHIALLLLGLGPQDEVIVPAFSFIATANVVLHVGATPVFVDIDYGTLNIDPSRIEEKITKKTRAIIPVDYVGIPCDMNAINTIAKKHRLFVIEDAAAAMGSVYKGKHIGTLADLTCFSFHARKIVTTGEGGMITTGRKQYADQARMLRHHGMSISDVARHKAKKVIHESYPIVGYNFRMSDIQAAVGVAQMKKIDTIIRKRTILAKRYTRALKDHPLLVPPVVPEGSVPNWQSYIIKLRKNKRISRDALMQKLLDDGIATRRGALAIHTEASYKNKIGNLTLPVTEEACSQTITLPLFPQMTRIQQQYVIDSLLSHCATAARDYRP